MWIGRDHRSLPGAIYALGGTGSCMSDLVAKSDFGEAVTNFE